MIITCPRCQKSFNIDDKLIPTEGRLVKCGACDHTWFFKPTKNIEDKQDAATPDTIINEEEKREFIQVKRNKEIIKPKVDKTKGSKKYLPAIKKEKSKNFSKLFLVLPTPDCIDVLVGLYIFAFFFVINGRGGRI